MAKRKGFDVGQALASSSTEEEVKAAYVRWLDLEVSTANKNDLLDEHGLWEFKYDRNLADPAVRARVLAQATIYLRRHQRERAGGALPDRLILADKNEAAICPSSLVSPLFSLKIDWRRAASNPAPELVEALLPVAEQLVVYNMSGDDRLVFAQALTTPLDQPSPKRVVTLDNFEQAYEDWCREIGLHFAADERGLAFMTDLAAVGSVYEETTGRLRLLQNGRVLEAHVPVAAYQNFWRIWHRPPDVRDYQRMLAHTDRLQKMHHRRRTGQFYTPLPVARLALDYLARELGDDWQDRYWVWDCCCGTGALTYYMDRYDRCFLSTLQQDEVDYVMENQLAPGACVFQYDYCNDDVSKLVAGDPLDGPGWKLPAALRRVLSEEPEKLVVLMNPPYAECGSGGSKGVDKAGVAETTAKTAFGNAGKASRELFTQFLLRSAHHRASVISVFCTMKLTNTDGYLGVRQLLRRYQLRSGFCVHSAVFHGTKGDFPVGFQLLKETEDE